MQRPRRNSAPWLAPSGVQSFLIQPSPACLEMVMPTEGWTLLHQHTKSRQCPHHEPTGEFGGGNTSVDGNSSQVCQVEK